MKDEKDWCDSYFEWCKSRSDEELLDHYRFMKRCLSLFDETFDIGFDDFMLNGWDLVCEACAERWLAMKSGDGNV